MKRLVIIPSSAIFTWHAHPLPWTLTCTIWNRTNFKLYIATPDTNVFGQTAQTCLCFLVKWNCVVPLPYTGHVGTFFVPTLNILGTSIVYAAARIFGVHCTSNNDMRGTAGPDVVRALCSIVDGWKTIGRATSATINRPNLPRTWPGDLTD